MLLFFAGEEQLREIKSIQHPEETDAEFMHSAIVLVKG